ncbi:MAG: hypothetical protein M1826_002930 [Phylliscum demangeonii]|nr:MAG: hypothetical protein M1826_002930 [Phylliscum demangeonii]
MPSTSQSLIRPSTDTELMPPPPTKRIKRPRKVLDEDAYTDAISHIIARDFFPGLVETRLQQEYLDALDSQDRGWIASASRKLAAAMTPGGAGPSRRGTSLAGAPPATAPPSATADTPRGYGGDTPFTVVSGMSAADSVATSSTRAALTLDLKMSLDNFQARYTSEDNESFNKVLDKQNAKRAHRYAWLWAGNKIPAPRQIAHRQREAKLLHDRAAAQEATDEGDTGEEASSSSRALIPSSSVDERKAMPDTWDSKPRNQFFFAPESVEDDYETVQQRAEATSRAPPRTVAYGNTRLPGPAAADPASVPPSPSISAIREAIAGRPRADSTTSAGGQTPRVNGYAYVDDNDEGEGPLEALSTAALLRHSGDPSPNPFQIREQSRRESLHHRMVDRVAKNNRPGSRLRRTSMSSATTPIATPLSTAGSSHRGAPGVRGAGARGSLTPAARQLWMKLAARENARSPSGSRPAQSITPGLFGGPGTMRSLSSTRTPGNGKGKETGPRLGWTPTSKA